MRIQPSHIPPDWLVEPVRSFDLAAAMRISLRAAGVDDDLIERMVARPPPNVRAEWDALVGQAAPADALWFFRSPEATWQELAGRAGFVLLRDGTPVAAMVTRYS